MNNIIYTWLLNNNNDNNNNNEPTIIELLIVLSINGILIDYDSLITYCNNNNNNNKNNKRINNHEYNNEYQSLHGLNVNQFQQLNNNIYSSLIPLHESNNQIKNYIYTNYKNIKNKFGCLINFIIENNIKNIYNQSSSQQPNKKYKTTTTTQTTDSITTLCISSYNGGRGGNGIISSGKRDIDYLFFKVWRSLVLRNEILFHTRLFNIHSNKRFILESDQLLKYKYKGYINNLKINDFEQPMDQCKGKYNKVILPSNLKQFTLYSYYQDIFKLNSINHLSSLTSLSLTGAFNQPLDGWIPKNLKYLEFGYAFQQSVKVSQLPESLTSLLFDANYGGNIEYGSIPKSVTTLYHYVEIKTGKSMIPSSTTSLKYDNNFNEIIKKGDIPKNVWTLEFGESFNCEIKPYTLPASIKTLKFGNNYDQNIKEGTLPPNLTSLTFGDKFDQQLTRSVIPSSIKFIEFTGKYNKTILTGLFLHTSLQSLKCYYLEDIQLNSLPNTLNHLEVVGYTSDIKLLKQVLPVSLKSLILNNDNIKVNEIPEQLTSLQISDHFVGGIEIGSFSSNLKTLKYNSVDTSSLDLSVKGLIPQTVDSLYLNCNNINLLNSFSSNYFHDKIKLLDNKQQ